MVRPKWKTVIAGAAFTGFLFTLGKLLLQWLLNYSSMQTIYGASAASVLLLLFVFYSSFIFYYGPVSPKSGRNSNASLFSRQKMRKNINGPMFRQLHDTPKIKAKPGKASPDQIIKNSL